MDEGGARGEGLRLGLGERRVVMNENEMRAERKMRRKEEGRRKKEEGRRDTVVTT